MNGYASEIVNIFLNRWTPDDVIRMNLDDYVDSNRGSKDRSRIGSIDTFCYWVEFAHWIGRTSRRNNSNELAFTFPSKICGRYGIVSSPILTVKELNEKERLMRKEKGQSLVPPSDLISNDGVFYEDDRFDEELTEQGFDVHNRQEPETEAGFESSDDWYGSENTELFADESTHTYLLDGKIVRQDNDYLWLAEFGRNRNEAFQNIKSQVLYIIERSVKRDFDMIVETILPPNFAWKIACLYSGGRIIPIFRKSLLEKCARNLGFRFDGESNFADLQSFLIDRKPAQFGDNFQYARHLLWTLAQNNPEMSSEPKARQKRRAVEAKNIEQQVRRAVESYTVDQRHNLLQNALSERLEARYGRSVVKMEENFVDVKLYEENRIVFYEVKSDTNASACIRNALGQILSYVFSDLDSREKKIVVVGQFPPNQEDRLFIEFLKQVLQIDFDYEYVDIPLDSFN